MTSLLTPAQQSEFDALLAKVAATDNVNVDDLKEIGVQRDIKNLVNMRLARDDPAQFLKQLDIKEDQILISSSAKAVKIMKDAEATGFSKEEARLLGRRVLQLQKTIDEITKDIAIGKTSRQLAARNAQRIRFDPIGRLEFGDEGGEGGEGEGGEGDGQ